MCVSVCLCLSVYVCVRAHMCRRAKASNGDNGQDPWSHGHSPFEYPPSAINNLHGNLVYAPMPIFAMDQPLALTKNSVDTGRTNTTLPGTGLVERQQVSEIESLTLYLFNTGTAYINSIFLKCTIHKIVDIGLISMFCPFGQVRWSFKKKYKQVLFSLFLV